MQITTALRLTPGDLVAFVGGGGKTSAMFRLAQELVAAGERVLATTTTRIFASQISLAPAHFAALDFTLAEVQAALARHGQVLVTGPLQAAENKATGLPLETLRELRTALAARSTVPLTVLVEADGSRMRPLKAPASHEPVIPPETTCVVPVVGAKAFGVALTEKWVHRPELVGELLALQLGARLGPGAIARLLTHPAGGLKAIPPEARIIPLLNQIETPAQLNFARAVAARVLRSPAVTQVVLGAVQHPEPIQEVCGRVSAVVLAAGRATRMGALKQLLPWGGGSVLGSVVRGLQPLPLTEIVVVTGAEQAAVAAALAREVAPQGVHPQIVFNPNFATDELAGSLQVGLRALALATDAVLICLGDQPMIQPAVIRQLVQTWRTTLAPVVAPAYQGQRGHPVLVDRALFSALRALPPTANPREVVGRAAQVELVPVDTPAVVQDLDTPAQYAALKAFYGV